MANGKTMSTGCETDHVTTYTNKSPVVWIKNQHVTKLNMLPST